MQDDTTAPTGGVDWATDTNEQCIVDAAGDVVLRRNTTHDAAGIRRLVEGFLRHEVRQVAIERPDGPVVDALLAADLEVVVITPRQVKHLRARYGAAGNKDDRFDAYVLADVLRTDGQRLTPLTPDSAQTLALRSAVRARTDLVEARVALCNQLRAHLRVVFPAVVGLFADLDSPISLIFLTRFPTADKAAWLSQRRLGAWLAANGYCGRTPTKVLLERLTTGPDGLTGDPAAAAAHTTLAYVETLKAIRGQITTLEAQIREQLALHPDSHIFTSLPRSGQVRAAKLLVEVGDARGRFPTEASLAALAGAAPSTRQSGRHHVVTFRWACDKKLRDAVIDFAADSRRASPWAAAIYDRHTTAGKTHQHASRILARAWLRVIWRCWQDGVAYDPTKHGGAHQFLAQNEDASLAA
ncbi:MAG: IS110 family transposase [Nitriliruptorales bacterium]|nr:IS110 family transposase [Nitriliruptorales bacterium]